MKSSKYIAKKFREVFLNGEWIANTNLKKLLSDVNWQQATTKIGNLNTIYQLTFHLNYYLHGVLNVLNRGSLTIKDKFSFDCPKITTEKEWQIFLQNTFINANNFAEALDKLTDENLQDVFVNEKYGTYLRNIDGLIEHTYYHLGQISLIKKLVTAKNNI